MGCNITPRLVNRAFGKFLKLEVWLYPSKHCKAASLILKLVVLERHIRFILTQVSLSSFKLSVLFVIFEVNDIQLFALDCKLHGTAACGESPWKGWRGC